jgi:predicted nuclease of predicted toxin-antitoxin system
MSKATDEQILQAGRDSNAIVVTLDADFHALLAASGESSPSVIRIRIEGLKGDDIAEIVQQVAAAAPQELNAGAAVSVTANGIRIRLLPLP